MPAVRAMFFFSIVAVTMLPEITMADGPARRVAMFPLGVKGKLDATASETLQRIQRLLNDGPSTDSDLDLFSADRLNQELGMPAQKAAAKCEHVAKFDQCLRKLVYKLNAQEMLTGRFEVTSNSVRLLVLAVDGNGKVEVRSDLVEATAAALAARVSPEQVAKIYAVPYKAAATTTVAKAGPVSVTKSEPTTVAASDAGNNDANLDLVPITPTSAAATTTNNAMSPPPTLVAPAPSERRSRVLRWTAVAIASVGVMAAGVGGYYGVDATRMGAIMPDGKTTQRQAFASYDAADTKTFKAKMLVGGGVTLAVVGGGLLIVDLASE